MRKKKKSKNSTTRLAEFYFASQLGVYRWIRDDAYSRDAWLNSPPTDFYFIFIYLFIPATEVSWKLDCQGNNKKKKKREKYIDILQL